MSCPETPRDQGRERKEADVVRRACLALFQPDCGNGWQRLLPRCAADRLQAYRQTTTTSAPSRRRRRASQSGWRCTGLATGLARLTSIPERALFERHLFGPFKHPCHQQLIQHCPGSGVTCPSSHCAITTNSHVVVGGKRDETIAIAQKSGEVGTDALTRNF